MVSEVLASGWLTSGPMARRFESLLEAATGAHRVLALSSGTAALHVALDLAGISPGDVVVVPVMTFTATAQAALYLGAELRFADVDPETMNLSSDSLAAVLDERVRAVVPVDVGGVPHDHNAIRSLSSKVGAAVVVDAAHSLGSRREGVTVGAAEDLAAFSFYVTKPVTTAEGGALAIKDGRLAERAESLRLHGMSHGAEERFAPTGHWRYDVTGCGYKYNLADVNAAIGVAQLERLKELEAQRAWIAHRYQGALAMEAIELPREPSGCDCNWHLFIIRLKLEALSIDRDRFMSELKTRGVNTSVHFIPLHMHSYYRDTFGLTDEDFPVATALAQRIVSLPIFPGMTDEEVTRVIETVSEVCRIFSR